MRLSPLPARALLRAVISLMAAAAHRGEVSSEVGVATDDFPFAVLQHETWS
jgi:hypothetical protein